MGVAVSVFLRAGVSPLGSVGVDWICRFLKRIRPVIQAMSE